MYTRYMPGNYMDEPFYDDDQLISNAYSALWKAATVAGLSTLVAGSTVIKVYGITYTCKSISPFQIVFNDPNTVALAIPNYNWAPNAQ
jgi:hypothetical protein